MVKIITKLYKDYIFDITIAIVFLIIGSIITIPPIFSQYFDNNITSQKLVSGLLEKDAVNLTKINDEMDKLQENVKFKSINKKVNLSKANLATSNLYSTNLTDVDLTGADLTDADLTHADLINANLTFAYLKEAILIETDLTNAILLDTNLTNADVSHAKFNGTFFNCASLKTLILQV